MAATAPWCNTCRRTLVKLPGLRQEVCPVCQTVNLFNQKIKGRVLFRIGQFINAATNQYLTKAPPISPPQSPVNWFDQPLRQNPGRKRAVLCGVTYSYHRKKLEASVHNVKSMQQLLKNKLCFPSDSICVLTEEESDRSRIPTKRNILMALQWLIQGCQPGDSLLFYYSGHACQIPDEDGDEDDGIDEALCPFDYREAGVILDDEINAIIVKPLTRGVTLHSVIDTCFSGTVLDLPFLCKFNEEGLYKWEEQQLKNKGTRGCKAVCISACADNQNSVDTSVYTGSDIGALTFSFIHTIENESKPTYGRLLSSMRKKVNHAQQVVGRFVPYASPMSQEPQLSSSTRFEIYSEPVII